MTKKEPATLEEAKELIKKLEEDLRVELNVRIHFELCGERVPELITNE